MTTRRTLPCPPGYPLRPLHIHSGQADPVLTVKPRRLGEVDREPIAFALVASGHFGAGVAEMLLDMGLLDLGRGSQAGAERMAAEREPPLALHQVPAQAGGERASFHQSDDVLVREA